MKGNQTNDIGGFETGRHKQHSTFSPGGHQIVKRHFAELRPQHKLISEFRPRAMDLFESRAGVDHLGHELLVRLVAGLQNLRGKPFELCAVADESSQGRWVGDVVFGRRPLVGLSGCNFQNGFVVGRQGVKCFLVDE